MVSVTQRIKQVKQPWGGYIRPKTAFHVQQFDDETALNDEENIHPILVGLLVDYLTRFINGAPLEDAFKVSLQGAKNISEYELAKAFLKHVKGLDDESIRCAHKLVEFDVYYRVQMSSFYRSMQKENSPVLTDETIENVRTMVLRSLAFIENYGPVTKDGFTFEGAYTDVITIGDGDYLTADTLWDFKVSKKEPNKDQTLQILIYYIMGKHSNYLEFNNIQNLGIFNPRLNKAYSLSVSDISDEIITEVSEKVIGYK